MNEEHPKIYGLILAGGKSSRFDEHDKSWLTWNGRSLIQHVIDRLQPQVDSLYISANRNIARYEELGYPVVPDDINNFQGPLAGIYSVMNEIRKLNPDEENINLLIAPCDMPTYPENIASRFGSLGKGEHIIVARDSQGLQPLVSLIPISLQDNLKAYLQSGQRKVESWIISTIPVIIDFPSDRHYFYNINSQSDFDQLIET